jgi:hypothetical protein
VSITDWATLKEIQKLQIPIDTYWTSGTDVSPGKSPNEKSHSLDALKSSQKKGHFMF